MSFKSIFFKEDPEEEERKKAEEAAKVQKQQEKAKAEAQATVAAAQTQQATASNSESAPISEDTDEINVEFKRRLWDIIKERNLPGPDMLEVKNFADSLKSTELSLEKRYEAAFLMLRSQYPDFTKESLLKSIDTYISFISQEHNNGKGQFEEKKNLLIKDKGTKVEDLKNQSQKFLEQIEELKQKHEAAQAEIVKLQEEIEESTRSIAHEEAVFNNTFNNFIEGLEKEKVLMSKLNIQ